MDGDDRIADHIDIDCHQRLLSRHW